MSVLRQWLGNVNRLRIGPRLALGFGVMLALVLCLALTGWLQISAVWSGFSRVADSALPSLAEIKTMQGTLDAMRRDQLRLFTDTNEYSREKFTNAFNERRPTFQVAYERYGRDLIANEQDRELWTALGAQMQGYLSNSDDINNLVKGDTESPDVQMRLRALMFTDSQEAFTAVSDGLAAMTALKAELSTQDAAAAAKTHHLSKFILGGVAASAVVLGALLAWGLTRSVVLPIKAAASSLDQMAGGDLCGEINADRQDETGDMMMALSSLQESLSQIVGEIRSTSDTVSTAAAEIASGNMDLSQRTENQAASLEETAASMETFASSARQSERRIEEVDALAAKASAAAQEGAEVVGQVVVTMSDIRQSSDRISEITGMIDQIAFQTNILALNAAVEAARAGEQGRGFAVVAGEVRTLAQRSATAAKEIRQLIADSAQKVHSGATLVGSAGQRMNTVAEQIEQVTRLIGEVRQVAKTQTQGIDQVNEAIGQLDHSTQQNAALVEQASAAAESLRQQAKGLVDVVSIFKLPMDASSLAAGPAGTTGSAASAGAGSHDAWGTQAV